MNKGMARESSTTAPAHFKISTAHLFLIEASIYSYLAVT